MISPLKLLDNQLNKVTMYKMLSVGLTILALISILLSAGGILSLNTTGMITSLVIVVAVSYATNTLFSRFWNVPVGNDSWLISALILFFIAPPSTTTERALFIGLAAIIAMASKFIVAHRGAHIFNPAAFGIGVLAIAGVYHSSWWIGSSVLWPFALGFGLCVLRKVRKYQLFASFALASFATVALISLIEGEPIIETLDFMITASPLIFLGTVMLTEPSTMPPRRNQQLIFGSLVGVLFAWHPTVGPLFIYPEIALLIGNVYAYYVGKTQRYTLRLTKVENISSTIKNFMFEPVKTIQFEPGQYIEWTLPHSKSDFRGNRRTFSIASSPTEDTVQIGVKFYEPSSSFKTALGNLQLGDKIIAGHVAGDFVLPKDSSEKIIMIAGGIGITPFRSMVKYLIDTKQKRDIVLVYSVSDESEIAYKDVLQAAQPYGLQTIIISPQSINRKLNSHVLKKLVPDYVDRKTYISGPNAMVNHYKSELIAAGTPRTSITTDYFSGY